MAVVRNALNNKLRDLISSGKYREDQIRSILIDAIGSVMITYCGANSDGTHAGVFGECAALMAHKYNDLSVEEIKEAFRLAAAREIDAELTSYKGVATVGLFGGVMAAYKEHRRKYIAEVLRAEQRAAQEQHDNNGADKRKEDFNKMVYDWFQKQVETKGAELKDYNQIPVYYYNTLDELGLINASPLVKNAYMSLASEVYAEMLREKQEKDQYERAFIRDFEIEGYLYALNNGSRNHKLEVTNIAKRILLEHIIKDLVK